MSGFSPAAVFSDNCVLQRNKDICIFGYADDGAEVCAGIFDGTRLIDRNGTRAYGGKWKIFLKPMEAAENLTIEISSGNNTVRFSNVAVGEVWLAGGQSNMEFELQNCTEGSAELELTEDPGVRFYYTQKNAWMDDKFFEGEKKSAWQTWDSEKKKEWSAVGYFFAKKLSKDLGVTVGIIGCNWGGTSASAWMSKERLEKNADFRSYIDEYEEGAKGKTIEEQCMEYGKFESYHAEWSKKCEELYKKNPKIEWSEVQEILGKCQWPGPKNQRSPYRPGGLHECMIKRIAPYTLKGFLFYQGESDDHKPDSYYALFREMIDQWRTDWNETLPMIFVQLPENRYHQDEDLKNWCIIREAQAKSYRTVANTGMATAAGLGQYDDIHPKAKKTLAERMERNALFTAYKILDENQANGPLFKSAVSRNGKMELEFDFAESGFVIKDDSETLEHYRYIEKLHGRTLPEDFTGFEIAGKDKIFYPASFSFGDCEKNPSVIIIESEKVSEPVYARYAWYNYGPFTIYGRNGIPLPSFRTYGNDEGD